MAPENLNQAIIDFLDSLKSAKRLTPCELSWGWLRRQGFLALIFFASQPLKRALQLRRI